VDDVYDHEQFKAVIAVACPHYPVSREYEMTMAYRIFMMATYDSATGISMQHFESVVNQVRFPKGVDLKNIKFKWARNGAAEVVRCAATREDKVQLPSSSPRSTTSTKRPSTEFSSGSVNISGAGNVVVLGGSRSSVPRFTGTATATAMSATTTGTTEPNATVDAEDNTRPSMDWSGCEDIEALPLPLADKQIMLFLLAKARAEGAKGVPAKGWSERNSFIHQDNLHVRTTTKNTPKTNWSASNGIEELPLSLADKNNMTLDQTTHSTGGPERECFSHRFSHRL
jgi:hypothetical protein